MVTPVLFNGPTLSVLKIEYGRTLIEAPRSSIARGKVIFPNLQGTVKTPGSLHFGGNLFCNTAEIFSLTLTVSVPLSFFFDVHSCFRNFAYRGTYFMASRSGMFTSTFRNVSMISRSSRSFLVP